MNFIASIIAIIFVALVSGSYHFEVYQNGKFVKHKEEANFDLREGQIKLTIQGNQLSYSVAQNAGWFVYDSISTEVTQSRKLLFPTEVFFVIKLSPPGSGMAHTSLWKKCAHYSSKLCLNFLNENQGYLVGVTSEKDSIKYIATIYFISR